MFRFCLFLSLCLLAYAKDQCCCFPASPLFERKLQETNIIDPYVLEHAMPTLRGWLASQCKTSYALVPFYAYYDVLENIVSSYRDQDAYEQAAIMYATMKEAEGKHVVSIQDALDKLAVCLIGACPLRHDDL